MNPLGTMILLHSKVICNCVTSIHVQASFTSVAGAKSEGTETETEITIFGRLNVPPKNAARLGIRVQASSVLLLLSNIYLKASLAQLLASIRSV